MPITGRPAYVWDDTAADWVAIVGAPGPEATIVIPFGWPDNLVTRVGTTRYRFPFAATLIGVSAAINTAPTGSDAIFDVNKNGTTVFTTQANRPRILAGAYACDEVTNMDITSLAVGDYLTVDIDQIGSTVPGADLSLLIRYQKV